MKIERTKNAARNMVWGIIEKTIYLLMPFLTRTVMIKVLGAEYLGLNSLFTSILQVLSISELGFGSAIVFSMYKPIAEDDHELLCALLNVYRKIYKVVATVILLCGLVVIPFLPKLIHGTHPADVNLYILYLVYLFNTVISYYLFAYKTALFSAFQRNDLISKRNSAVYFLQNLLQIILLLAFRNYYVYVIVIPVATILTNLLNARLADKMYPEIVCVGDISAEMKGDLKKRITGLLSFKIYGVVFSSVDAIVISGFLGLTSLAIYNNYYYVQQAVIGFLTIFLTSLTAGIGNKMNTNTRDDNYEDFKKVVFINGWLSSWCAICLFVLYQHFMKWWVGEELMLPVHTMLLMVIYFWLPKLTTVTMTYREAAGLWWEDRIRPLVSTVVNLTANLILVQIIGMDGVVISTLICTVFIQVPWGTVVLFKNYFKRSPAEYFAMLFYNMAVTVLAGGFTYFLCDFLPETGLGVLVLKGIVCVIVPNIIFWIFYHKMKEFSYIKNFITSLPARHKKKDTP